MLIRIVLHIQLNQDKPIIQTVYSTWSNVSVVQNRWLKQHNNSIYSLQMLTDRNDHITS